MIHPSTDTLDFSKLSLHHTKRMEMETLVKVLETEKQLEVERSRLSELRKHHYKLAGEIEGWDQEVGASSELGDQDIIDFWIIENHNDTNKSCFSLWIGYVSERQS